MELMNGYKIHEVLLNFEEITKNSLWISKTTNETYHMLPSEPTVQELLSVLDDDLVAEKII